MTLRGAVNAGGRRDSLGVFTTALSEESVYTLDEVNPHRREDLRSFYFCSVGFYLLHVS